jgi:hypothetical protein
VERNLEAAQATTFDAQIKGAGMCWDRQVNAWFEGAKAVASARGAPIRTWAGFLAALRANYTPVADEMTAWNLFMDLRMAAGETMERYTARAAELYNRLPQGRIPAHVAADLLIRGVSVQRFPLSSKTVRGKQMEHRSAGGLGMAFEVARALLVAEASTEPTFLLAPAAGSGGQREQREQKRMVNSVRKAGGGKQAAGQRFLPPEEEEEEQEEEAGRHEAGEQRGISAITPGGGGMKCYRCGGTDGHTARECKEPETRTCHKCKKPGHLAYQCPVKKGAGSAGAAPGGVQPKKE